MNGCNLLERNWIIKSIPLLSSSSNVGIDLIQKQNDLIQRTLFFVLIPVVVAFSFIVFVIYRARRESEFRRKEAELKLHAAESELTSLRAQMNPHFIFNCLNSIHHYMHTDQNQAQEYLIKFSRLIRHVLETSSSDTVPLKDEIEAIQNYIQLERLRMNNSFDFKIVISPDIMESEIFIPAMLIQPVIENAIWHGLNQQGDGGRLMITFGPLSEKNLLCTIEDNGKNSDTKSAIDLSHTIKKTSLGLSLTKGRLRLLFNGPDNFEIEDIIDQHQKKSGRRVKLLLPFKD